MSSSPPPRTVFITSLPSEVLEQLIIHLALIGSPQSISNLGKSCKFFHDLIYNSPDHHLWRQIFLTTFDDTRYLLAWLKATGPEGCSLEGPVEDAIAGLSYPWEWHYQRRVRARREYGLHGPNCDVDSLRHIGWTMLSPEPLSSAILHPHPHPTCSILPPLLSPDSTITSSSNLTYVSTNIFGASQGLPLDSASMVLRNKGNNIQEYLDRELPLYKLAFLVGFDPRISKMPVRSDSPSGEGTERRLEVEESDKLSARSLARRKVYDMRYTTVEQCWGPYILLGSIASMKHCLQTDQQPGSSDHPHNDNDGDEDPAPTSIPFLRPRRSEEEYHPGSRAVHIAVATRRLPVSARAEVDIDDDDDDDDDLDDDDFDGDDSDEDDDGSNESDHEYIHPPLPHRLIPDYSWLSAARFLIECNLCSLADEDWENDHGGGGGPGAGGGGGGYGKIGGIELVTALKTLDLLRMGGAPGFWERGWRNAGGSSDVHANDQGEEGEHVPGWDWAGVEGKWMRTVCWIGYPDLIHLNRHLVRSSTIEPTISEQVGIFPLTLRVTGYLPPPALPPNYLGSTRSPLTEAEALVYKLPIILVEGQAVGSDHHPSEERVMKGSIRMIGDGAVRWTMKSRIVGTNRTEWVTEGIQMGAIGSALGVMGLWTGPEHQRHDPLGPWWMWKVSDTPAL